MDREKRTKCDRCGNPLTEDFAGSTCSAGHWACESCSDSGCPVCTSAASGTNASRNRIRPEDIAVEVTVPGRGWIFIGHPPMSPLRDLIVSLAGTVASIQAATVAGRTWMDENLPPDLPGIGDEALVGQTVVAGIVERATAAGLKVQQRSQ